MKKIVVVIIVLLFVSSIKAQFSVGIGPSSFVGIGSSPSGEGFATRYGISAFYEQPRNEINTFYLRGILTLPINRFDSLNVSHKPNVPPGSGPSVLTVDLRRRTTMFSIDGGTRTYFFNTYEVGTAFYGSLHLRGIIASYNEELGEYDESIYEPSNPIPGIQYSLLMGVGGNLGVKYQLPYKGIITFDAAIDLIRRLHDPAFILVNDISPLSLTFNLAYRFDWY